MRTDLSLNTFSEKQCIRDAYNQSSTKGSDSPVSDSSDDARTSFGS